MVWLSDSSDFGLVGIGALVVWRPVGWLVSWRTLVVFRDALVSAH